MQSLNLVDYIKIYNVFESNILKSTLNELQDEDIWSRHLWVNEEGNTVERNGNEEMYNTYRVNPELKQIFMSSIFDTLTKYITDINIPEFCYWQGYSPVIFKRYSQNQTMAKHIDRISSIFDGTRKGSPVLSIVGLLNDNFTGGEFIMFDSYKINMKAGDILIFPSSFTYPHKVNHITSGTRYSFVSWAW